MIFHPVRKLTDAGIDEIPNVTGVDHMSDVVNLLGSGKGFGCRFNARRVARRFGLEGEIVPVRTAIANLAAPRPPRGGLRVERARALLKTRPLDVDAQLEGFHAEWAGR